ncbi:MAG: hypothetical protein ACRDGA_11925, partial [Bacteroidota bacterium]
SSSWSFLYRGTGLDYHDGFGYRQNQLGGSMVQLIALGNNFLSTRVDLTYINSNSSLTENNTTLYGEVGYGISGGWLGGTVGGYWSDFADERTVGGSLLWWLKLGELTTASVRVNADRFSGTYRDAESFYSAKAALSSLISNRVGFLVAGTAGRRSLFYEQDIKLVYNTLDVLTREVSTTMFLYPAVGTTMLIDVTFDRFEAFNGGTYRVVYLTTGVSFVL